MYSEKGNFWGRFLAFVGRLASSFCLVVVGRLVAIQSPLVRRFRVKPALTTCIQRPLLLKTAFFYNCYLITKVLTNESMIYTQCCVRVRTNNSWIYSGLTTSSVDQ